MSILGAIITAVEQGRVPDRFVRWGIRRLLADRLREIERGDCEQHQDELARFVAAASRADIAMVPEKANEQHYEWPAGFFQSVLGHRLKYSCCLWRRGCDSLDAAEDAALEETCQRAGLANGQTILELGCGWGSLSLWMAERYPDAQITSVSNSHSQREFIERQAEQRGLSNLTVVTSDMNDFNTEEQFDRVVSIEMFEHMRNHRMLLQRIGQWLKPGGKLFVHIFCHRQHAYLFETEGEHNWMGRYFFSGGMMPSDNLLLHYQDSVRLEQQWRWSGSHYEKTSNAWLAKLDRNREQILEDLKRQFGDREAVVWLNRWRMFFMACAELFGFQGGQQWWVSHYLFERSPVPSSRDLVASADSVVDKSASESSSVADEFVASEMASESRR